MIDRLKCLFGFHNYAVIRQSSEYCFKVIDDGNRLENILVIYEQCVCCKKRRFKALYRRGGIRHSGVETERYMWERHGLIEGLSACEFLSLSERKTKNNSAKRG